ncbi:glutathione S-transferase 1-like [Zerene cesonia]|uniref:glutathione S-transferase 1-like n=1 Tax=Zerene cesonia TaxID=33412 RepID=UPI0018E59F1E|nr:glutathione S-transferase 1-like [Zerene cesonia]
MSKAKIIIAHIWKAKIKSFQKLNCNNLSSTIKMAKFYKIDGSPPARAVMMLTDILKVPYEEIIINPFLREQDTPELTKKNPMKTIPLWEEDNFNLADSHAIMLYLFDKHAKPEHSYLYPEDRRKRATINQRLFFDCGLLFPRLRSIMAGIYTGRLTAISKSMIINVEDSYRILEAYLSENVYLADDVATLADISVMTTMSSLHGLIPIDHNRYPKLMQWYNTMKEKDYCKRLNEPGAIQHVMGLKTLMEHNKENAKAKL